MPINFEPKYSITPQILSHLLQIERTRERITLLPLTPSVLLSLRETARLYSTHYSTMIEGNRLDPAQIQAVLENNSHFPGKERDEKEIRGYYAALQQVEEWANTILAIQESHIQKLHAIVMSNGNLKAKGTPYRDGQNVIRDSINPSPQQVVTIDSARRSQIEAGLPALLARNTILEYEGFRARIDMAKPQQVGCHLLKARVNNTRTIVYMPPEAKDVPPLMKALVTWLNHNKKLPSPIKAAIAHYQFATIHPYYDGNGRTARLLTTLLLHLEGYDLKGIYSLEEYYAQQLQEYYRSLSVGPSHNYYLGRAEADITIWIEYFLAGMARSFEKVSKQMEKETGKPDLEKILRKLAARQRKILELFLKHKTVTATQIGQLFGLKPRTSASLCQEWLTDGFLEMVNTSNKARSYRLSDTYEQLLM
ncbi:MAG: Fic family protein [Chlamydiia bacterium]|nr:Fic family protein [Chlamydiia bacterium]